MVIHSAVMNSLTNYDDVSSIEMPPRSQDRGYYRGLVREIKYIYVI